MSLTHFKPVFPIYISYFWMLRIFNNYVALLWVCVCVRGGVRIFDKKRFEKTRVGGFLFSARVT